MSATEMTKIGQNNPSFLQCTQQGELPLPSPPPNSPLPSNDKIKYYKQLPFLPQVIQKSVKAVRNSPKNYVPMSLLHNTLYTPTTCSPPPPPPRNKFLSLP